MLPRRAALHHPCRCRGQRGQSSTSREQSGVAQAGRSRRPDRRASRGPAGHIGRTEAVPSRDSSTTPVALFFDGRAMIDEGVPEAIRSLQDEGLIDPLTTVYVESIEGSTTRGPARVASLTDPAALARFVDSLHLFLERQMVVPSGRGRARGGRPGAQPGRQRRPSRGMSAAGSVRCRRHQLRRPVVARRRGAAVWERGSGRGPGVAAPPSVDAGGDRRRPRSPSLQQRSLGAGPPRRTRPHAPRASARTRAGRVPERVGAGAPASAPGF